MARLLMTEGCHWSLIAKKLGKNRTEHMIKNRYKTILCKQKKLFPQIKSENALILSFVEQHPAANEKTVQPVALS